MGSTSCVGLAGMMVSISLFEMLPLARKYDPHNKVRSLSWPAAWTNQAALGVVADRTVTSSAYGRKDVHINSSLVS